MRSLPTSGIHILRRTFNPARLKIFLTAISLALTLSGSAKAQQDSCLTRTIPVNVRSDDGTFINGLTAQNFRGKVHGQAVEFLSVNRDASPDRMVLILDASGSMGEAWNLAVSASEALMNTDSSSSFALITFADRVENPLDFSQGREKVASVLAGIEAPSKDRPKGRTRLYDGLAAGLNFLRPAQFGDAVYLVTDGGDNASTMNRSQLKKDLLDSGARLFALIPEKGSRVVLEENDGPIWTQSMAIESGGDMRLFRLGIDSSPEYMLRANVPVPITESGQEAMTFAATGFDEESTSSYQLTLKLPEPLDKPSDLKLEAMGANGKRNDHWQTLYPHYLTACP
jgi:hypothetical protein